MDLSISIRIERRESVEFCDNDTQSTSFHGDHLNRTFGLAYLLLCTTIGAVTTTSAAMPEELKIATWNLEWFMTTQVFDELRASCFASGENPPGDVRAIPCDITQQKSKRRTDGDIAKLREYVSRMNADVIALQEVDTASAAALVFPDYEFCFTKRAHVQNVGFAVRRGISYQCNPDFIELGLSDDRVRWGADITLFPNSKQPLRLLGVHLKSGCHVQALNGTKEDCKTLAQQVPALESWIDARAREGAAYIVIGDFNRKLNDDFKPARDATGKLQSFWNELDDGEPPGAELVNVTASLPFKNCSKQQKFNYFIDDIVLSKKVAVNVVPGSVERIVFDDNDVEQFLLSDHCPIAVRLKTTQ